jgi:hypothetical protein
MTRAGAVIAVVVATFAGGAACVDTSAVEYTALQDAGSEDAGADSSPDDGQACLACVSAPEEPGPGCAKKWVGCAEAERCAQVFTCAAARGCLASSALEQRLACSQPCFDEVGLKSTGDPIGLLVVDVSACTLSTCRAACVRE